MHGKVCGILKGSGRKELKKRELKMYAHTVDLVQGGSREEPHTLIATN